MMGSFEYLNLGVWMIGLVFQWHLGGNELGLLW